eukprot:3844365-Rhodomonas_salina.2
MHAISVPQTPEHVIVRYSGTGAFRFGSEALLGLAPPFSARAAPGSGMPHLRTCILACDARYEFRIPD